MGNIFSGFLTQDFATKVFQIALLAGSAYVAANPKYAWIIPVLQATGAITPSPMSSTPAPPTQPVTK